jgi:hypothetical protein
MFHRFLLLLLALTGTAFAQTNLRAWYAAGQVWVVWQAPAGVPLDETTDIYLSAAPPLSLAQMTLAGRLLPWDYTALRLKKNGVSTGWRIPQPGALPPYQLLPDEGVFACTPHAAGAAFFAVVQHGQTQLTPGVNLTTAPVAFALEPVTMHIQHQGVKSGRTFADYALWIDGQADHTAGRPDFPAMGNHHCNGTAHVMRLWGPQVPPASGEAGMTLFYHGTKGTWLQQQPGDASNADVIAPGAWFIGMDDQLAVLYPADAFHPAPWVEDHQATKFWGYWEQFDRFDRARVMPPPGSLVVGYTTRRVTWMTEWALDHFPIDRRRVVITGHSMGANGASVVCRYKPELYSAGLFFQGSSRLSTPENTPFLTGEPYHFLPTDTGLDINTLFFPGTRVPGRGGHPFSIQVWGVNDDTVPWFDLTPVPFANRPDAIAELSRRRSGNFCYWDEREHGIQDWSGHWAGAANGVADGTPRHTAPYLLLFRNDQGFPGFSNDTHSKADPFVAVPDDAAANADGRNWGTQGGFYEWDHATIEDTPLRWSCALWMIASSSFATDVAPDSQGLADVTVFRAQSFKPAPGTTVRWRCVSEANPAIVHQSGTAVVSGEGLATASQVVIPKETAGRRRLIVEQAARIEHITRDAGGTVHLTLVAPVGAAAQLQHSPDLVHWTTAGTFQFTSPTITVSDPPGPHRRFYKMVQP